MSLERHVRVKEAFLAACDLPTEERSTYLDEVCGDDAELRREVMSLLEFHEESTVDDPPPDIRPGERVAGYRILQRIGEGGMGTVYEAEQLEPVRRRVALKVIKLGMDTSQVVRRFEAERQALALMDHPNIARILDAGATERGRPFFAMEFVSGEPVTAYCDRQRLDTRERLELFVQICEALQHAHQKGIIHRDIKPSNVMVRLLDDRPVPTIIDFGIAKATQHRLIDQTMNTAIGMMIGTPEYMSPEQAEMSRDVDTRTDVYSLGVLLYELLVGALPFDSKSLGEADLDEIRRRIREDEPSRPSTRVGTLGEASKDTAERRSTDPPGLRRQLRGDLDWITLRALEKDRGRRYASPSELSADIARHLRDEPVVASPPSVVYRTRKFVRRHRVGVAAGITVAVSVFLGLALATNGLVRARRAEDVATQEAAKATKVSELLIGLFDDLNRAIPGYAMTPEQVLDRGIQRIEDELAGEPVLQARLMGYVAGAYGSLGRSDRARELVERSVVLCRENLPPDHPVLANAIALLGDMVGRMGDLERAQGLHEEALGIRQREAGPDEVSFSLGRTFQSLGSIAFRLGEFSKARSYLDKSEKILELERYAPYRVHLAHTLFWQALLDSEGDLNHEAALPRLERTLEILQAEFGQEHSQTWRARIWLGQIHYRLGDVETARTYYEGVSKLQEDTLGTDSHALAMTLTGLGEVSNAEGEFARARENLERALPLMEESVGMASPDAAWCVRCLATAYQRTGAVDDARRLLERNLEELERGMGSEHAIVTRTLHELGFLELRARNLELSRRWYRRALEIQARVWPPGHNVNTWALYRLACIAALEGRKERALELLQEALDCGYDRGEILEDAELASLRGDPRFEEIMTEVRRRTN